MPLVTQDIPNIANGVSQQPAVIRLQSQGEAQSNCQSSVVDGMKRRAPTRHLAKITSDDLSDAFFHVVQRDSQEKYAVVVSGGDLKVFDIQTGQERTVAFPDGQAYLASSAPRAAFRAVTAADYTFLVNRGVLAGMTADKSEYPLPTVLFSFIAANYKERFTATVDGKTFTLQLPKAETDDSTREALNTNNLALALYNLILTGAHSANGITGTASHGALSNLEWAIEVQGSCVKLWKWAQTDFTVRVEDGSGGTHLRAFKGSVQNFTDLPKVAIDGFKIKVIGAPDDPSTDYWVEYQLSTTSAPPVDQPGGGDTGEPPPTYEPPPGHYEPPPGPIGGGGGSGGTEWN